MGTVIGQSCSRTQELFRNVLFKQFGQRLLFDIPHAILVQCVKITGINTSVRFNHIMDLAITQHSAGCHFALNQQIYNIVKQLDADQIPF